LIERGEARAALVLLARAPASADVAAARSSAHLALGEIDAALSAARTALELDRHNPAASFNLGRALMEIGEPEAAAAAFADAERLFAGVAEISARLGEAAYLAGDDVAAEAALRRALDRAPAHPRAFALLAELLHQRADGPALDRLLQDATQAGGAQAFRAASVLAGLERRKEALEALARVETGAAPSPAVDMLAADVLRKEGDHGRALVRARAAASGAPDDPVINAPLARLLLTTGALQEAERVARRFCAAFPDNQLWRAFLWTALAAQGAAEADALLDFERDIFVADLAPPAPCRSIDAFNAALAAELSPLHHPTVRGPLGQSVQGGSQTRRPLQSLRSPALTAFFALARETADRFAAALAPPPDHPGLGWRGKKATVAAAWSVALAPGGRHSAHVHPAGAISSAYYVEAPGGAATAGGLALGEPPFSVPGLERPRRLVDPVPGRLVLFPSWCWHGTAPFTATGRRLTIAFDLVFR
jgi:Flp pilus assembly protein TadD